MIAQDFPVSKADQNSKAKQLDRFKEAARAFGCDEDEAAFDEKLKAITPTPKTPKNQKEN